MESRIRVLVVDDSALMRRVIWGLLEEDPDVLVVGSAVDGLDAIEKVAELKPDVVTLDVEMPRLDGLAALQRLMAEHPVRCIMLSAFTPRGAEITLKALDHGAADFVQKPSGVVSLDLERVKEELLAKVKVVKNIDLARLLDRGPEIKEAMAAMEALGRVKGPAKTPPLIRKEGVVVVGASTGGPRALGAFLTGLPKEMAVPVLVVQHMSAGFTKSLAERLDKECKVRVKEGEHGEVLQAGTVYMAPGDWHMSIERSPAGPKIKLDQTPPVLGVRPCADLLFQSAADVFGSSALGVVLTGMGRDGARGSKQIKAGKGRVLAQDEATSVVFGMPRAAEATGCVDRVVPIGDMAAAVMEFLT